MAEEIRLSPNVVGKVGYSDGHVEVAVTLPWPLGTHSLVIQAHELDDAARFIKKGLSFREKLFGAPRRPKSAQR